MSFYHFEESSHGSETVSLPSVLQGACDRDHQARSQGCGGATHPPPNLAKGPLLATKWSETEVFVRGLKEVREKVYFRSQILERPRIGEYWNIFGVPVLNENVISIFYRTCWCYSEAYNTGTQKWSSLVQYLCTSIWDLKYTFSVRCVGRKFNFHLGGGAEHEISFLPLEVQEG